MWNIELNLGHEIGNARARSEESQIKEPFAHDHTKNSVEEIEHTETAEVENRGACRIESGTQGPGCRGEMQDIVDQIEMEQTEHEPIRVVNSRNIVKQNDTEEDDRISERGPLD